MKNISYVSGSFQIWGVKFSIYLNRHVFVLLCDNVYYVSSFTSTPNPCRKDLVQKERGLLPFKEFESNFFLVRASSDRK